MHWVTNGAWESLGVRIYGALAGLAIGDALGMAVEFLDPDDISRRFGWVEEFLPADPDGPHPWLGAGEVTDDTWQVLVTAEVLWREGRVTAEAMSRALVDRSASLPERLYLLLGPSTRRALEELRAGGDPRTTGREGVTAGACLRAAVVGLANAGRPGAAVTEAVECALPTHGAPVALGAAAAVGAGVAAAAGGGAHAEVLSAAVEAASRPLPGGEDPGPVADLIRLAVDAVGRAPVRGKKLAGVVHGVVGRSMAAVDVVPAAFAVWWACPGRGWEAVCTAVNLGGDADTIAALVGCLAGAQDGVGVFPPVMVKTVEERNRLPLRTWAERLTELALARGVDGG